MRCLALPCLLWPCWRVCALLSPVACVSWQVNGVSPSSPVYGGLAGLMLVLCGCFLLCWLCVVLRQMFLKLAPKTRRRVTVVLPSMIGLSLTRSRSRRLWQADKAVDVEDKAVAVATISESPGSRVVAPSGVVGSGSTSGDAGGSDGDGGVGDGYRRDFTVVNPLRGSHTPASGTVVTRVGAEPTGVRGDRPAQPRGHDGGEGGSSVGGDAVRQPPPPRRDLRGDRVLLATARQ